MSERIIYIVTSGDSDCYNIEGVFEDPTLAQEFVRVFGEDARVEEHPISLEVPKQMICYVVRVDHEGNELARWRNMHWGTIVRDGRVVISGNDVLASSFRSFETALLAARDKLAEPKAGGA